MLPWIAINPTLSLIPLALIATLCVLFPKLLNTEDEVKKLGEQIKQCEELISLYDEDLTSLNTKMDEICKELSNCSETTLEKPEILTKTTSVENNVETIKTI